MLTLYSALAFTALSLPGQEATTSDPSASTTTPKQSDTALADDQVLVLDPFSVTTDHEGYKATDTLGGARVRTKLVDTPSSISVITPKFMQDLGITNAQDLLVYTNNTEVAGLGGNFSGVSTRGAGITISGAAEGDRLKNPAGINRSRGLTAMDNTRNYFQSDIPWDGYNISRTEVSRGPNSFLFGVGSPSGINNVSTNEATYKNNGAVEAKYSSFGSARQSVDLNRVLLPSLLALRLDLVNDDTQYRQKPAFNHSKRVYGAVRFDPKLFGDTGSHTKIQANFEHGRVNSNNPREIPPLDYVTGYLNDARASTTGYNPWTYRMNTDISADPTASSWAGSGSLGNQFLFGGAQQYWDAATGALLKAGAASFTAPSGNGYGAISNTRNVHSVGYASYAATENYKYLQAHNQVDGGEFKGAYKGTVNYLDKTISDPSIFDFRNKLIDGDNKREWQRWNAFNVSVVQGLFDDRLVLQGVIDRESYTNGQKGMLNSRTPVIVLDLSSYLLTTPTWLAGAQTNANVGRPAVFGDQGNINIDESTRNNYQLTAAYNLDFERDFGAKKSFLAKILGRHEFTGLGGRYTKSEVHRSYKLNGIDRSYQILSGDKTSPLATDNGYSWAAYVGPNLLGTSGPGANLSNLAHSLKPPSTYPYTVFSKEWTAGTSVSPADPWTYTGPDGTVTATQADNPANYRGYTGVYIPTIYGDSLPDVLATGGNKKIQTITSRAFVYQGHFWDDTIIPTLGYRQDKTRQRGNDATQFMDPTTHIYNLGFDVIDQGVESTTTSKSWGVALHLPKSIKKHLPEGTDVSLYYFHGANETPKVRYALDGSQLPNESGKTDDYSIQFDGLKGRLSVRLTYFKTVDKNAQASYGQPLGNLGYYIDAIPQYTVLMYAYGVVRNAMTPEQVPANWDGWMKESWGNWPGGWINDHPAEAAAVGQALRTDFIKMFPQSYWDAYGYKIDVAAIQRGDWQHIVKNSNLPWFNDVGGSHQIHGEYAIIDQNLESKGYEVEATIRPLKNWDITFNGSKVNATQTGLGEAASRYLTGMADLFLGGPLQHAGIWGGYDGAKNMFMQGLWAPYLTQVALTGSDQPELRKYHFNIISNYKFDRGFAKGFNVGVAYRWQSKNILGYGLHQTTIYGESAWIADVSQPIYGPTDSHVDFWVGYEHKLTPTINWRVQLNVRNVTEHAGLVPISVEPDGSVAQSRIKQGQTYDLSCKFLF